MIYKSLQTLYLLSKQAKLMTVTSNDRGQQNMWAKEPTMYTDPNKDFSVTHNEKAEMLNGRVAMISIIIGVISYISTGKLFFFTW